jgi:transposase
VARYALWKNPDGLTDRQQHELDWIAKTDPKLWRAYLLKEALRYVFAVRGDEGKEALRRWLIWARRSQLPAFVDLHPKITAHRDAIEATLEHGLSNALVESANTKIRLLTRIAFGFHGHQPLIALALLAPRLPPPTATRPMTHGSSRRASYARGGAGARRRPRPSRSRPPGLLPHGKGSPRAV